MGIDAIQHILHARRPPAQPKRRARALACCGGAVLLVLASPLLEPGVASARMSKYARKQQARGDVTDMSAKLATHAFIDDRKEPPWRLTLFVDTLAARTPFDQRLLQLTIGLSREGKGEGLQVAPDRFRLSWPDAAPLAPLSSDELLAFPNGAQALRHDRTMAALTTPPVPFDVGDGTRIDVRFYVDPSESTLLNDRVRLLPASWFVDELYFVVPDDLDRWRTPFELAYLGPTGEPLVSVAFRIEPDPERQQRAFRRARAARRKEDAAYARHHRAAAPN